MTVDKFFITRLCFHLNATLKICHPIYSTSQNSNMNFSGFTTFKSTRQVKKTNVPFFNSTFAFDLLHDKK